MARITQRQIDLLREAVALASDWRGNMVGAAPQEEIEEFDAFIKGCEEALTTVRAMRKETTQPRPYKAYGPRGQCKVHGCEDPATTPDGLCSGHFY